MLVVEAVVVKLLAEQQLVVVEVGHQVMGKALLVLQILEAEVVVVLVTTLLEVTMEITAVAVSLS
jgi:hypothetical protein